MNKEHVQIAIDCMEEVVNEGRAFDMGDWQNESFKIAGTQEDLLSCGYAACFGGWLALYPGFIEKGGSVDLAFGRPLYAGDGGEEAVSSFLEIEEDAAEQIVALGGCQDPIYDAINVQEIKPQQVLNALIHLRDNGNIDGCTF